MNQLNAGKISQAAIKVRKNPAGFPRLCKIENDCKKLVSRLAVSLPLTRNQGQSESIQRRGSFVVLAFF
jgi:hypothetical protein